MPVSGIRLVSADVLSTFFTDLDVFVVALLEELEESETKPEQLLHNYADVHLLHHSSIVFIAHLIMSSLSQAHSH